ncbi:unnamed protein product [Aphanomyces euteiches]|uniref:Mini-chromosome maintenance complex-binding protein n=1 Tax=Aphanomyces euteiches TaxID=100861 RepID=A0A6G0X1Y0_9STRA|nr:hypothetical protein Ae201684_009352 [Aphanomyces euteiches]
MTSVFLTQELLDAGRIPHGSQVRWIGLVRDVGQPQLIQNHDDELKYIETTPHRCELVPGRAQWLRDEILQPATATSTSPAQEHKPTSSVLGKKKRSEMDDTDLDHDDQRPRVSTEKISAPSITLKRPAFQVIVRAYDGIQYKVNHAYEFVGELDLTPQAIDDYEMEWQGEDAETSKQKARDLEFIPTLHAKVANEISYGLEVLRRYNVPELLEGTNKNKERIEWCLHQWKSHGYDFSVGEMRGQLVAYFASFLDGDTVAAEYLLLCLLSRVYHRSGDLTPFGHLSVNVIFPGKSPEEVNSLFSALYDAIANLVPTASKLNLSIESLCGSVYYPQKDYTIDYLHSGLLQMPDGTVIMVNESEMSAGQLDDKGTQNIRALVRLVESQTLMYDFQFYQKDFHQDIKVISISKAKSILPMAVNVYHSPSSSRVSTSAIPEALIQCLRLYLAVFRSLDSELGNEGAHNAEVWYVEKRKEDNTIGPDDLSRLVRVARLEALGLGFGTVDSNVWHRTLELDQACTQREKLHTQ